MGKRNLKICPFCGSDVKISVSAHGSDDCAYIIHKSNEHDCLLARPANIPTLSMHHCSHDTPEALINHLIDKWNSRSKLIERWESNE